MYDSNENNKYYYGSMLQIIKNKSEYLTINEK